MREIRLGVGRTKGWAGPGSGSACVMTPHETGRAAGMTWQAASRHARALKTLGLVTVTSLPKQTSYKLTGQGEACLALGKAAGEA